MGRTGIAIIALLIGAVFVSIGLKNSAEEQGHGSETTSRQAEARERGARFTKSPQSSRQKASELPALKQLRALRTLDLAKAPKFRAVDDLARRLSDAELQELIGEIGFGSEKGLEGWVRNALYAEWGRRDPTAALAHLASAPSDGVSKFAVEQSFFAVYRGWAEKDPGAAAGELASSDNEGGQPFSSYWRGNAYKEVFKHWARHDSAAAWQALPKGHRRDEATAGFLRGLGSEALVRDYIERWMTGWQAGPELATLLQYEQALNNRSRATGLLIIPADELIAGEAAMALARFDLEAAVQWTREAGPGGEQVRGNRLSNLLRGWAKEFPAEAMELIGSADYPVESLGRGILLGDLSRGVELMEAIENPVDRGRTLMVHAASHGSHHVNDFFPIAGGRNRLPKFAERYQDLLDAVEAGRFSSSQENSILPMIHRSFRREVEEARLAHEGRNR